MIDMFWLITNYYAALSFRPKYHQNSTAITRQSVCNFFIKALMRYWWKRLITLIEGFLHVSLNMRNWVTNDQGFLNEPHRLITRLESECMAIGEDSSTSRVSQFFEIKDSCHGSFQCCFSCQRSKWCECAIIIITVPAIVVTIVVVFFREFIHEETAASNQPSSEPWTDVIGFHGRSRSHGIVSLSNGYSDTQDCFSPGIQFIFAFYLLPRVTVVFFGRRKGYDGENDQRSCYPRSWRWRCSSCRDRKCERRWRRRIIFEKTFFSFFFVEQQLWISPTTAISSSFFEWKETYTEISLGSLKRWQSKSISGISSSIFFFPFSPLHVLSLCPSLQTWMLLQNSLCQRLWFLDDCNILPIILPF